jgi:hypothetical protein
VNFRISVIVPIAADIFRFPIAADIFRLNLITVLDWLLLSLIRSQNESSALGVLPESLLLTTDIFSINLRYILPMSV